MGCCSVKLKKAVPKVDYTLYLSTQQLEDLTELFKRFAVNDILHYSHFTQVFSKLHNFPEAIKQSAYSAFCRPGDKSVDLNSFLASICKVLRLGRKDSLEFLFKIFDLDKDGELNAEEFGLFVKHFFSEPYLEFAQKPKTLPQFVDELGKLKEFNRLLRPLAIIPTIEGELEAFSRYQGSVMTAEEGMESWLVASPWMASWKDFVEQGKNQRIKPPRPPSHIDNHGLNLPNSRDLKPNLQEHQDYELLTKKAWMELYKQYGGGPEIIRKYVQLDEGLEVELYPPVMIFYRSFAYNDKVDPSTRKRLVFTRKTTLEEALGKYKAEYGLQGLTSIKRSVDNKTWETLDDMQQTLGELKPSLTDSYLVVSVRDLALKASLQSVGFNGNSFSTNGVSQGSNKSGSPTAKQPFLSFKKPVSGPGLVGLANLGQTCYMNCVLQCLAHIPPLKEAFIDDESRPKKHTSKMTKSLAELFAELWGPNKYSTTPLLFAKSFKQTNPRFSLREQHDSHDFLAILLDNLNDDLKPRRTVSQPSTELTNADDDAVQELGDEYWNYVKQSGSSISNICAGLTKIKLSCRRCSQEKVRFEDVLYLSVAFDASHGPTVSLDDCLKAHFSEDKFEATCERCDEPTQHSIQIRLYNAPQVLIICLKRFSSRSGRISKINRAIDFPVSDLDLSKLVTGRSASSYDLKAVVNHFGDIHHGHYTAVCKNGKQWIHFDDDDVTVTSSDPNQWAQSGYILFYQLKS